ncbi:hypothetical protein AX769_17235 [Frondihabitans sp. PAMC 28766]|nr:hypothetical protein AX769_17235 [Frondihabitans sp. PAMC 28766]
MSFEKNDSAAPIRAVTDARALRALAHPIRLALIEILSIDGPMTATEAADKVGESPSTCSFHLRQLAQFGFVEEAGGGKGRARPWKMTSIGLAFDPEAAGNEAKIVTATVTRLVRDRQLERYRAWQVNRESYPVKWRKAAIDNEFAFWMTADELDVLGQELETLLTDRFRERLSDPSKRPDGSVPVELLTLGYPMRGLEGGDDK